MRQFNGTIKTQRIIECFYLLELVSDSNKTSDLLKLFQQLVDQILVVEIPIV